MRYYPAFPKWHGLHSEPYAIFSTNILFLYLILIFLLVNSLSKSVKRTAPGQPLQAARGQFLFIISSRSAGHTRWLPVSPKLTAMAASTFSITAPSTRPMRSRSRFLSKVRICSSKITESFGRPLP